MRNIILIILTLLFFSCSSADWDIIEEFIELEKGQKLKKTVFSDYPVLLKFRDKNIKYKVFGKSLVSSYRIINEGGNANSGTKYFYSPMYFIFKNEKLYYWGYLWEMKQFDNKEYELITKEIVKLERKQRNE